MDENEKMLRAAVDDLYNVLTSEEVSYLLQLLIEMTKKELKEFIEYSLAIFHERDATSH
ncbi:hypothetical protein [Psychrobacillus sp. L3]|uniref:hypothetical protein n=1 Tax=Psychrobacillus sp. L3 TaxID=3236891 RepID=UPI0036F2E80B